MLGAVTDNIGNNAHGGRGWIDESVSGQILFENIVLDRSGQLFGLDTLLFGGNDIGGQNGNDGPVHCH